MSLESLFKTDIAHVGDLLRSSSGGLGRISGVENLQHALFHRLMTVPGTLVHRPTYGVGLPLFQNGLASFAVQQQLAALIEEQFLQDPRVREIQSVGISAEDSNPALVVIRVFVRPNGYTDAQEMIFTPFSGGQ